MTDTYYAALLAQNPETQAGILHFPANFGYQQLTAQNNNKYVHFSQFLYVEIIQLFFIVSFQAPENIKSARQV